MTQFEYKVKNLEDLNPVADEFVRSLNGKSLIAFIGKMGAGKTTFIKAICKSLKVTDLVNSPTFSIINQYLTNEGDSIFHFDFYRLEQAEEALDIGIYDYWDSGSLCLMEWPEKVEKLLPEECVYLHINEDELSAERIISWEI